LHSAAKGAGEMRMERYWRYVLFTGGICYILLAMTYWFFDVKSARAFGHEARRSTGSWTWPLLVFGTNAIVAYVVSETLPRLLNLWMASINGKIASGLGIVFALLADRMSPETASLLSAMVYVGLIWLLMLYLYRKKIIIRI
jgi:predicted acyltransferase